MNDPKRSSTLFLIAAALLASGITACNLVDDEPDIPIEDSAGSGGQAGCLAYAEVVASECMPPQQLITIWEGGGGEMVLIDDPAAAVSVGPGGWLVQVSSSADYVGTHHYEGDSCTVGCGYCAPGQDLCFADQDEDKVPECVSCMAADAPDAHEQCALFVQACAGAGAEGGGLDETGSDGGLDETGSDGGLDETGSDGEEDEPEGVLEYDCSQWEPSGSVTLDVRGNAIVDAAIVEEIAVHYGDPLADCDHTRFHQRSDGYFAIGTMAPNGLLAQMGLQPGDTILAINGMAMDDIDTIAATTVDLFMGGRITSGFTLAIERGRERFARTVHVR